MCENYALNSNDFVGVLSKAGGTLNGELIIKCKAPYFEIIDSASDDMFFASVGASTAYFGLDFSGKSRTQNTRCIGIINEAYSSDEKSALTYQIFKNGTHQKSYTIIHSGNIADYVSKNISTVANMTVTGSLKQPNLTLYDGVNYQTVVTAYDDGDDSNFGCELSIGGNGNTFIGAGESYKNLQKQLKAGNLKTHENYGASSERLYISSDNEIYFETNCNTIDNRNILGIGANGRLWTNADRYLIYTKENFTTEFVAGKYDTFQRFILDTYHSDSSFAYIELRHYNDTATTPRAYIGVAKQSSERVAASGEILSTLNRPSGSYTGNGTYPRTINIGGNGKMLIVLSGSASHDLYFVTSENASNIYVRGNGNSAFTYRNGRTNFTNGVLNIYEARDSDLYQETNILNDNGATYSYIVL